jgi:hypothetical protein
MGVVSVVGRQLDGGGCRVVHALLTFLLGVRCYLCVRPWSRTNTGAFWFGMDLDTVIEVCVTFHYAWAMEHD